MALCTKEDVKVFLKISDSDKDTLITILIPAAQGLIEEYCNRIFEKGGVTEYSNGGVDRICLKRYPVTITELTPLEVYEDGNREFEDDSLVDSTDYYVDTDKGIIYFDYLLEKTYGAIKITYTGGYTVPITVASVNRKRVSNVATIETNGVHGLTVGDNVLISGLSGTGYNGTWLVASIPNTIHFTFANTGSNETEVADTGGTVTGDNPSNTIIPQAIKQVCIELVSRKLKTGVSGDIGLVSKGTPGGISIAFNQTDLLPEAKIVLDIFRSWASG
jgi:hypothetical protein